MLSARTVTPTTSPTPTWTRRAGDTTSPWGIPSPPRGKLTLVKTIEECWKLYTQGNNHSRNPQPDFPAHLSELWRLLRPGGELSDGQCDDQVWRQLDVRDLWQLRPVRQGQAEAINNGLRHPGSARDWRQEDIFPGQFWRLDALPVHQRRGLLNQRDQCPGLFQKGIQQSDDILLKIFIKYKVRKEAPSWCLRPSASLTELISGIYL